MSKSIKESAQDPRQNGILAALPKADYQRLLPHLESVSMPLGWTLSESGDHVKHLYFPTSGIISLIYDLENGSSSEVAIVGSEGMVGISIYMGGESMPSSTEVQCAGMGYRLNRVIMKREFAEGGRLQQLALLYAQALICQTSQTAVCNQHHALDQRLCRWLLMSLDRVSGNKIAITQELIASLLGVRRESVSETASKLQEAGFIEYRRGYITVSERTKLEKRACECYQAVTHEYERLLPAAHSRKTA